MAAEHQFFYEDEVYRINKKGNVEYGMVLENSELVSSDENSDIEEGGRMKKGHIRVAWHPTGVEVIPERKVHLADRSLMPGDVVRRMIKGKDTQRGYCRDIKVTANVQVVGTKQVIPNVKSEHLIPLEEFATDIAACLDSWVGGIKSVHSKLHVQLADGSKCVINDLEACGLEDFTEKRGDCDCEFTSHREDFYPGQTLWGPLHCLEDAEWIQCTKEMKALRNKPNKTVKVVVEEVKTDCVGVHWQCRAYSKEGAGVEKEQPKYLVQGDDLKRLRLLNVFEPCTLQVGDRNFYTFREEDTFIQKEQWRRSQRELVFNASNAVNNSPINAVKRSPKRSRNKEHQAAVDGASPVPPVIVTDMQVTTGNPDNSLPATQPVVPMEVTPAGGEEEEWDTEDTASVSDAASISSGASSIGSQGRKKRGPALMTKVLKKKKLRRTRKRPPPVPLTCGMRIVVETLSTSSIADVVWQDGSVELGIPSTQLYPIHHLDDQEFFPGDFVIENKEDACMQVYGVVQSVDHAGRTAAVKWFKTYTSVEQPQPSFLEQNEVSVYDLKDHPDFQYRPGTVVIRVANFEGEDVNCTAGQVLDNYPEGMVRVWWVDGHISMSWPQDLYKVGEYDSDEGELWDDNSSDASWETESEDCVVFDDDSKYPEEDLQEILKPKLGANIEKARIAMSRLEEIFTQNPALQTTSVMRQLLDVYKDCRYLDRLMGTSFFHESHFQGLLERVRERGRANVAQRVADQVNRLFSTENAETDLTSATFEGVVSKAKGVVNSVTEESFSVPPTKDKISNDFIECKLTCNSITPKSQEDSGISSNKDSCGSSANESFTSGEFLLSENLVNLERHVVTAANNSKNAESFDIDENSKETKEKSGIRTIGFSKQRCLDEKMDVLKHSSCHSPGNNGVNQNNDDKKPESMEVSNNGTLECVQTRSGPWSVSNSHVCVRLCSLIKAQLVKAHGEVTRRFGGNQGLMALSEALNEATEVSASEKEQKGEEEEVTEAADKDPLNIGLRSLLCSKSSPLICAISDGNSESPVPQETPPTVAVESENSDEVTVPSGISGEGEVTTAPITEEQPVEKEAEMETPMVVEPNNTPEQYTREAFSIMDSAPNSHKFKLTMFQPTDPPNFFRTVRKELKLLRSSLPEGIWVKGFEDRMDLYSVMIRGPEKTPYEGGLFFFDFQLSADYPKAPPLCHYISYCSDRLNPNLYEDGKVCVSLLGTWSGKGTEVWTSNSNLLQVIVSIQGLILVSEPYFNEAGYEKQKGSQQGKENSRMYNEMAVLKLVQAMTKLILQPPIIFKEEILDHFRDNSGRFLHRLDTWLEISERYNNNHPVTPTTPTSFRELHGEAIASAVNVELPEFPLIPASKGFCLTLRKTLVTFNDVMIKQVFHRMIH